MNIHRIYIYAPLAGTYPTDLEQALAQGEQLRRAGEGHEVPRPLLSMAENLEDYVRGLSEGCEEEAAADPLLSDLEDLILGMKDWLLAKGVPVISFEMPVEGWRQLLWKLVDLARPHGLVVVDSELMLAFLPTGKVYPESRQSDWDEIVSALSGEEKREIAENLPRTVRQYIAWSSPYYDFYLTRNGFARRGKDHSGCAVYERDFDYFSMRIVFNFQVDYPIFSGLGGLSFNSPKVCSILETFQVNTVDNVISYIFLEDQMGVGAFDNRPAIGEIFLNWEEKMFDKYIFDVVKDINDLKGLDIFFSESSGLSDASRRMMAQFNYHQLVVAKLANQRDFQSVVCNLRAKIPPLHKIALEKFDQIAAYLEQISPL